MVDWSKDKIEIKSNPLEMGSYLHIVASQCESQEPLTKILTADETN